MISKPKKLFERRGQAPAPSKDYHQILVTEEHVTFTTWRICLRKGPHSSNPTKIKMTHEDFFYDTQVSSSIRSIFGKETLIYIQGIVNKDWLMRMEDPVLIRIFSYLDLSDIFHVTPVCRHFRTICNSNELWMSIYKIHCLSVKKDMFSLGDQIGWKNMFFTNRIQIRKAASRLKRSEEREEKEEMENLVERLNSQHISDPAGRYTQVPIHAW